MITMYQISDTEMLRLLLDKLNDEGCDYRVSGIDNRGEPFLAFLSGAYAEAAEYFSYNPYDPEIDVTDGVRHCEECLGFDPLDIERLHYPLVAFSAHHVILEDAE